MAEHTYSVKLIRIAPERLIEAIKAVRMVVPGFGLAEAKGVVDYVRTGTPVEIVEGLPQKEAMRAVTLLAEAWCEAELIGGEPPLSPEDQDSLLRVVRAAMDAQKWRTARGETAATELAWSLNALPPHLVARLSEGG